MSVLLIFYSYILNILYINLQYVYILNICIHFTHISLWFLANPLQIPLKNCFNQQKITIHIFCINCFIAIISIFPMVIITFTEVPPECHGESAIICNNLFLAKKYSAKADKLYLCLNVIFRKINSITKKFTFFLMVPGHFH